MNLMTLTSGIVSAINPMVSCILQVSTGYTKSPDFKQVPSYADPVTVQGQVQSLQYRDLLQIEGLNLQGTRRAIYLQGDVEGLVRPDSKGGDLITMPDGTVWLVAIVLENWNPLDNSQSGWVKVCVTLQNKS